MSERGKTDESFVVAIKLATMRNCMLQNDEEKAFRLITENALTIFGKIMKGDIKNLQNSIRKIFTDMNTLMMSKIDRILKFIENLRKLDQDISEYMKDIGNIQQRWEETYRKLEGFDLNKFGGGSYKSSEIKVDKFQQDLLIDFKVYDELLEFEKSVQSRSKEAIKIILKSNPKTEINGLAEILLNDEP